MLTAEALAAAGRKFGVEIRTSASVAQIDTRTVVRGRYFTAIEDQHFEDHWGIDFPRIAALYEAGKLPIDRLITRHVALDEVNSAFDDMRARRGGRAVIVYG